MPSASTNQKGRFLPKEFDIAHNLCFLIHDAMVQIIKSGEDGGFFKTKLKLKCENERHTLENSDDIFSWLESEGRLDDRAKILKAVVLQAALSDMMHCVFEALENARKAKLSISYMLIRKPLQESLYLLEALVLDEALFAENIASGSLIMQPKNTPSVEAHEVRIKKVIEIIGVSSRFDAQYIAQLRYNKKHDDNFDGICNKAMHLFTERPAIRTEKYNINFIFSGHKEKYTQWSYLYSRLPYLLFYMHRIVEHIIETIVPTSKIYLDDIQRRIASLTILWWSTVSEDYKSEAINYFVIDLQTWLNTHCTSFGYQIPNKKDLLRMSKTGAYPKESTLSVKKRNIEYEIISATNKM